MTAFRRLYGAGPGHLLAFAVCFALTGFALSRIFAGPEPWNVVLWLALAIVAHDFVFLPLYTVAGRVVRKLVGAGPDRPDRVRVLTHLAVPAMLSSLLFLAWLPLILRLSASNYRPTTGMPEEPYLWRWLAVSAALFALSALVYVLGKARGRTLDPEDG